MSRGQMWEDCNYPNDWERASLANSGCRSRSMQYSTMWDFPIHQRTSSFKMPIALLFRNFAPDEYVLKNQTSDIKS